MSAQGLRTFALGAVALSVLCVFMLALVSCGGRQESVEAPVEVDEEADEVDQALGAEIDRLIALDDQSAMERLEADLQQQVALLSFFRSPRTMSLAAQWRHLAEALQSDDNSQATPQDDWGGEALLGWVQGLRHWELTGGPEPERFQGLNCEAPGDEGPTLRAYGECLLERIASAFGDAEQRLTPLQKASLGDVSARAHAWLIRRALPIGKEELSGAQDPSLQIARAWTGLGASEEAFEPYGAVVALRIHGAYIAYPPAVFGVEVLEPGITTRCTWPGEEIVGYTSGGSLISAAAFKERSTAFRERYEACASLGPEYAQDSAIVAIDSGLRWNAVAPVLREMLELKRRPKLLVRDVESGQLSGLPVGLAVQSAGDVCGVEAHLRRDGVVLRGGGAPMHLVSWTDKDAFTQLTDQAKAVVERCDTPPTVQIAVDDGSVDWGLIVRVIERMSWPQVCDDGPCIESTLLLGR